MAVWLSRVSIKWILPPLLVAPLLALAIIMTILAYSTGRETADELANENMRQIHGRIEEHLSRLMDLPPAINELNKQRLVAGQLSLTDVEKDRQVIFETLRTFPAVSSIVLGSHLGQTMWIIRYPGETTYEYARKIAPQAPMEEFSLSADGQLGSDLLAKYKFQPQIRPWYIDAIAADGPTWGRVYIWVRGGKGETLGIPYVEPTRDAAGKVVGVINCEITLSDISAYLAELKVGKTGKAFLLEPDGNLVATSTGSSCMKDGIQRMSIAEADDPWIVQAGKHLAKQFGSLDAIKTSQNLSVEIEGRPMRLVVSPYTNRRNLRWLIVTLVPDSDFLAAVQANRRRNFTVAIGLVLIVLLLSIALARRMMRPLLALASHVREIGEGHFEQRIHLTDSCEMARLSEEINEMAEGLEDRVHLRQSLALAMDVQQNLLPAATPHVQGLDIAGHSAYCDETGGDYYDFLDITDLSETTVSVAVGDVAGHGIAAAMVMAGARGILRSHCGRTGSLCELLQHMNTHLCHDQGAGSGRFMTMFLMTLDAPHREFRWASAGHDMPFIYDPERGFERIDGSGIPLGIMTEEIYEEHLFTGVRSGQIYLVGTDGVWETFNNEDKEYGKQRICDLIELHADQTAQAIATALDDELASFRHGRPQLDDVTLIVIKVL